MTKLFAIYFFVFGASYLGVEIFRRWSLKREIIDIPNERSSHTVPTPRGGGFVICLVSTFFVFLYSFVFGEKIYWSYFAGAVIVALISLIDDIKTISPFLRIMFHSSAAVLVIWELGAFEQVLVPFYGTVNLEYLGVVLTFLWIVWLINSYNFMDGIDGLAAIQAVTAGIGWSLTGYSSGADLIGFYGATFAASSLGFLIHNWQPAKIFMGDVGSAFLGYSFAVLPLLAIKTWKFEASLPILPWIAVLFVWFFVFDSVYTFVKRLFRRERVWEAHREHIYQKLVISGLPHALVTLLYGGASAALVLITLLIFRFSMSFESLILPLVFAESIFLMIFFFYRMKFVR